MVKMKAQLVCAAAYGVEREIMLENLPVMVGRGPDAGIRLADPWVSRRHCEIDEINGTLVVRDLGSRHGTFVNGHRVTEWFLLPGSTLTLGISRFVAQYGGGEGGVPVCAENEPACKNSGS
jgi:pSer/pThr/pTyr-binding forkhead associated (FHA) protein